MSESSGGESISTRLLGGSWVVISRVISRIAILITRIRGLITLLITTHSFYALAQLSGSELGFRV